MHYCQPPSNATEVGWLWTAGAFNQCVFDSVVAGLQALIMMVCGGSELRSYYRYSTRVDPLMLSTFVFLLLHSFAVVLMKVHSFFMSTTMHFCLQADRHCSMSCSCRYPLYWRR